MRHRQQKGSRSHYLILANRRAGEYSERVIRRLTGDIRRHHGFYTVVENDQAQALIDQARSICRLNRRSRSVPQYVARRGPVTALVAAGGDGTVNLTASVAVAADLPMGILPMGRMNNIARSLCKQVEMRHAISAIVNRKYRAIDAAFFGRHLVVGSVGLGLMPQLAAQLNGQKPPRFAFRFAAMVSHLAERVEPQERVVKLDAFQFDIKPRLLSINLLPYTLGLKMSPASLADDHQAEVIFDVGCTPKDLGQYLRDVYKNKFLYGAGVRLYRGAVINIGAVTRQPCLIDGEVVEVQEEMVELQIGKDKLKVFC